MSIEAEMKLVTELKARLAKRALELELEALERHERKRKKVVAGMRRWRKRKRAEARAAKAAAALAARHQGTTTGEGIGVAPPPGWGEEQRTLDLSAVKPQDELPSSVCDVPADAAPETVKRSHRTR